MTLSSCMKWQRVQLIAHTVCRLRALPVCLKLSSIARAMFCISLKLVKHQAKPTN
ncbi:hypothetical protein D9M69_732570 [compost metagenome]